MLLRLFALLALTFSLPTVYAAEPMANLVLAPLPTWARDGLYSAMELDIDKAMSTLNLSRLDAVEMQNHYRDAREVNAQLPIETALEQGLQKIKNGVRESGYQPITFVANHEFVVALDLDETMLMQWYEHGKANNFYDLIVDIPDTYQNTKSYNFVKFTPGWDTFLRALAKIDGFRGYVFFTAKEDAAALDIVRKWLPKMPVDIMSNYRGVFTRNHLVLGKRILIPSKDLRLIDADLKHVILVDDNPARVVQLQYLRAQPKFDGDAYYLARSGDEAKKNYYEKLFQAVAREIADASEAARRLNIPFAQAYIPYSYQGERLVRAARDTQGSYKKAVDYVRLHPELLEAAFVVAK